MRLFLFITALFAVCTVGTAQELVVVQETSVFKRDYHYRDEISPDSIPNYTIERMALITAPTLDNFFGFVLYAETQLIKLPQNRYKLLIKADSITYYNKLNYKGYTLNDIVFPDRIKVQTNLKDENNKQSISFTDIKPFNVKKKIILQKLFTDSTGMAFYSVSNPKIDFFYSAQVKKKLDSVLQLIDKVAELQPKLMSISKTLEKLAKVKAGMVRLYNIDLKIVEKELAEINPEKIVGSNNTVIEKEGTYALYDSLLSECKKIRKLYNHMMKMPEYEYFSEGYRALQRGENNLAASYFLKSISQKNDYPPPYYYLAQMAYNRGDRDSCASTILYIINELKPDFTIRKKTLLLGSKLYNTINYQAEELILKHRINEAVRILKTAINLCQQSRNELVCNGNADKLLAQAKQELFNSWTSITAKSIENNKVDLSIDYLKWTQDFFRDNREYLSDSTMLDSLKIKLIHLLVLNASAGCNSGDYRKSVKYTQIADSLCAITNYDECADELRNIKILAYSGLYKLLQNESIVKGAHLNQEAEKLKDTHPELIIESYDSLKGPSATERYKSLINKGLTMLDNKRWNEAYDSFKQAAGMETKILEQCDSLPLLMKKAAKPMILSDLKSGNLKAWGMHYKAVNSILKLAREEALEAGLDKDPEIVRAMAKLEHLAYENKCAAVSIEFTKNLKVAEQNINLKAFMEAEKNWNKAIFLAKKNPECNLDINIPLNKKTKYRQVNTYLKTLKTAYQKADEGNDSLAVAYFFLAAAQYQSDSLQRFGLAKPQVSSFSNKYDKSTETQYFILKYLLHDSDFEAVSEAAVHLSPAFGKKRKYDALLLQSAAVLGKLSKEKMSTAQAKEEAKKIFPSQRKLRKEFLRNL